MPAAVSTRDSILCSRGWQPLLRSPCPFSVRHSAWLLLACHVAAETTEGGYKTCLRRDPAPRPAWSCGVCAIMGRAVSLPIRKG